MARQQRQMEGDANQRRQAARDAHATGKKPSEVGATLGASKQRKEASSTPPHGDKLAQRSEGKRNAGTSGKPRPGNREKDPKRSSDKWR